MTRGVPGRCRAPRTRGAPSPSRARRPPARRSRLVRRRAGCTCQPGPPLGGGQGALALGRSPARPREATPGSRHRLIAPLPARIASPPSFSRCPSTRPLHHPRPHRDRAQPSAGTYAPRHDPRRGRRDLRRPWRDRCSLAEDRRTPHQDRCRSVSSGEGQHRIDEGLQWIARPPHRIARPFFRIARPPHRIARPLFRIARLLLRIARPLLRVSAVPAPDRCRSALDRERSAWIGVPTCIGSRASCSGSREACTGSHASCSDSRMARCGSRMGRSGSRMDRAGSPTGSRGSTALSPATATRNAPTRDHKLLPKSSWPCAGGLPGCI